MMRKHRKGLTLAELVMAISITAVIGMVISGVSVALSNAYANTQSFYKCLASARSAMINIQSVTRDAKLVTYMDGDSMVLWSADINSDGVINLSELVVLEFDSESNEINQYSISYPDDFTKGMKIAFDSDLTLTDAMNASIIGKVTGNQYVETRTLAKDATTFKVSADVLPPLSTLVKIELATTADDGESVTLRSAASLRAPFTDYVCLSDGEYVIDMPNSMIDDDSTDDSDDSGSSDSGSGSYGGYGGRGNWWWWWW